MFKWYESSQQLNRLGKRLVIINDHVQKEILPRLQARADEGEIAVTIFLLAFIVKHGIIGKIRDNEVKYNWKLSDKFLVPTTIKETVLGEKFADGKWTTIGEVLWYTVDLTKKFAREAGLQQEVEQIMSGTGQYYEFCVKNWGDTLKDMLK